MQTYKLRSFQKFITTPFNEILIEFLNEFGNNLRIHENFQKHYELHFLSLWCSRKNIFKIRSNFPIKFGSVGRGIVFHISPKNLPLNFFYSFTLSLLAGNSNIIKLPNGNFKETNIVLDTLKKTLKKKKYSKIKSSNLFFNCNHEDQIIKDISLICDARMIWGGDKSVGFYKKLPTHIKCIDLTFPDKYSISVIDLKSFKKLDLHEKKNLAKKFFLDTMLTDQNACNSPHSLVWVGKKNSKVIKLFWSILGNIINEKYSLDEIGAIDKFNKLAALLIKNKNLKNIYNESNKLIVIDANKINNLENLRGINGLFFSTNISKLQELKKIITQKYQTITVFGFDNKKIFDVINYNNLSGVDRVVEIGRALEFNHVWDGYNIIDNLSRKINFE